MKDVGVLSIGHPALDRPTWSTFWARYRILLSWQLFCPLEQMCERRSSHAGTPQVVSGSLSYFINCTHCNDNLIRLQRALIAYQNKEMIPSRPLRVCYMLPHHNTTGMYRHFNWRMHKEHGAISSIIATR